MVSLCIHSGSHYLRILIFLSHFLSRLLFPECISTHRIGSWLILSVMQTLLSAANMLQIINIPGFLIKSEELIWWMPSLVHVMMLLVLWSTIWKIKQRCAKNQIQWLWCKILSLNYCFPPGLQGLSLSGSTCSGHGCRSCFWSQLAMELQTKQMLYTSHWLQK